MNADERVADANGHPVLEFEAPPAALALIYQAARILGAHPGQAAEAARTGELTLSCIDIGLACDVDDGNLIAASALGTAIVDDPARTRAALLATFSLLARFGVAIAIGQAGAELIGRWRLDGGSPQAFADWLRVFASLGEAMRKRAAIGTDAESLQGKEDHVSQASQL